MSEKTYKYEPILNLGSAELPKDTNLRDAVLNIFPDANPSKLKAWEKNLYKETLIGAEPILFIAMICGVYFRITDPDVDAALDRLYKWFTGGIHNRIDPELAEILMEALTPGITKAVLARGHKTGSDEKYTPGQGAMPRARGAWVVAFLVVKYLHKQEVKITHAKQLALELASILLGRRILVFESYRTFNKISQTTIDKLIKILLEEYEVWLRADDVRANDPMPSKEQEKEYKAWLSRHKTLQNVITSIGYEYICERVFNKIPPNLLKRFWKIKSK